MMIRAAFYIHTLLNFNFSFIFSSFRLHFSFLTVFRSIYRLFTFCCMYIESWLKKISVTLKTAIGVQKRRHRGGFLTNFEAVEIFSLNFCYLRDKRKFMKKTAKSSTFPPFSSWGPVFSLQIWFEKFGLLSPQIPRIEILRTPIINWSWAEETLLHKNDSGINNTKNKMRPFRNP